jgi:hypothetical protein
LLADFASIGLKSYVSTPALIALGPVLIILATLLVIQASQGVRWAPAMLVILAASDLATYGLSYAVLRHTSDLNSFIAAASHPLGPTKGRLAVDVSRSHADLRYGNRLVLAGFSLVDGYAGLEPARRVDHANAAWLDLARVEWERVGGDWQHVGDARPKAEFPSRDSQAKITHARPGAIEITTETTKPETLFVSESYHAGWTARVDGQIVPVMQAEGTFLSCEVPKGTHRVELRFEPTSLRFGLLLTMCGLGLTMGWLLVGQAFRPDSAGAVCRPLNLSTTKSG